MKLQLVLLIWWLQLKCITCSTENSQRRKFAENAHFGNKASANTNKDPVVHEKVTSSSNSKEGFSQFKPSYADKVRRYSSQNDNTINIGTMIISTNKINRFGNSTKELVNKTGNSSEITAPVQASNHASCLTNVKNASTFSSGETVTENDNLSMIAQNALNVLRNSPNSPNEKEKSIKKFSAKIIGENEHLNPSLSARTVSKSDLHMNPSIGIGNKTIQNYSSNDKNNYDILHKINESKDFDGPKSSKSTKKIAVGYEMISDERVGTDGKYLLHSISVYDGEKFIYGVKNIKHLPIINKKKGKKGVYDKVIENVYEKIKPDYITQVRKKIQILIQDKIVILYKSSVLLNFFNDKRSSMVFIRDIWCLHKFIHIVHQAKLNCKRRVYDLHDFIIHFTSSAEKNMLYSENNKMTNAELMAKASWIIYEKLAVKWENELSNLFGDIGTQANKLKETANAREIPYRGIHCDLEKYTLQALFPTIENFNLISFMDFEVDDVKNEAKQISILKENGKSNVIIFRSREDDNITGNEPWLIEERFIKYGTNQEMKTQSKAVNIVQKMTEEKIKTLCNMKRKFIAHQSSMDFIKFKVLSIKFLKEYGKCIIDLRAVLRGRGLSEKESNMSLKELSEKYLHFHYEADEKMNSITRAAICGQLYKIFRFENKPKVIFDDLESNEFKFKV